MKLQSYVCGQWVEGANDGTAVANAVNGEPVCQVNSDGIDFAEALRYGRETGGPALRAMTFHERANALKAMAKHLMNKKEEQKDTEAKSEEPPREALRPLAEKIGFAKLDLTIEEVEERISPRETNVFDK